MLSRAILVLLAVSWYGCTPTRGEHLNELSKRSLAARRSRCSQLAPPPSPTPVYYTPFVPSELQTSVMPPRPGEHDALADTKAALKLEMERRFRDSVFPWMPSARTPNMSKRNNLADQIEMHMGWDGHNTWGLVIYRSTYESERDWTTFVLRLQAYLKHVFDHYNGTDVLEKFSLNVMEDKEAFHGADTATIRHHFSNWAL